MAKQRRRKAPSFKSHKRKIKICAMVPTKSAVAQKHLRSLHRKAGKRGHVKVPGYKHHYIFDRALRKKARKSSSHYKSVIRSLSRKARKRRSKKHVMDKII